LASWLVAAGQPDPGRSGIIDASYFYRSAEKLLAPMLFAAAKTGRTMSQVVSWTDTRALDEVAAILLGAGSPQACDAWTATMKRDSRSLDAIVSTTETVIAAFADPLVGAATEASDFTPADLLSTRGTLYLVGPIHEQQRLRATMVALVKAVLAYAYDHGPLTDPLLLVLDEAANIAPIPDLDQVASTAAGVGIQIVTVVQDLAQLEARYGDRSRTIISNHRAVLGLAGLKDLGSLRALSELVGDHEVARVSRTHGSDGRSSQATATEHRRLAPVESLRRMKPGNGLLLYGSARPVKVTLR
jgi:type IV secretion system protein VirD4